MGAKRLTKHKKEVTAGVAETNQRSKSKEQNDSSKFKKILRELQIVG
jgi:hypothetical protein